MTNKNTSFSCCLPVIHSVQLGANKIIKINIALGTEICTVQVIQNMGFFFFNLKIEMQIFESYGDFLDPLEYILDPILRNTGLLL